MKKFVRNNGLSIVMFFLFFIFLLGQIGTGFLEYNDNQQSHNQPEIGIMEYLGTGHFIEAVFENWESEFLQMAAYVVLTIFLFQKGSSESKDPEKSMEAVDADPRKADEKKDMPGAVKRGGIALKLYENSLSIAFVVLFLSSLLLHAYGGVREYNQDQVEHGQEPVSFLAYMGTSRFWFESFQNWQSEFLSVGVLIVFSIFLRQKGSPESKPVAEPNSSTGT